MAFPKSYAFLVLTLFLGSLHVVLAANYAMFNSGDGNFEMHWTFDGSKLKFNITCKATGWCAVAFSTTDTGGGMVDYDIAAGGVGDNGDQYLGDYWSTARVAPPRDANQNLMLIGATQSGEYTSVQFERYAMTGDTNNDVQFGFDTQVFIIWAMHSTTDASTSGSLGPRHTVRKISTMKYNLIEKALAANPLGMSLSAPNGKFMISWMYNGTKLVVNSTCQTTGWCAVGFTTTADGKGMVNYDIALGGVRNMTTYLYDLWSNSTGKPPVDGQQDLMLIEASEANGYTNVQFARNAMTGDTTRDVQLAADTYVWIVWSMSMNDANSSTEFSVHNSQGIMPNRVSLLKGMVMMPTTTSPPTTTETTTTTKSAVDVVKSRATFVAMLAAVVACLLSL